MKQRILTKKIVNTDHAPSPVGPYNQSVVASGALVFVSGQIALDPATNMLVLSSIEEETHRVMKNIKAVLQANDCTLSEVVSCSVFVKNMDHYGRINEVYGSYFDDETAPTRALVEVSRLPKDVNVEISAIAVKSL
ncbi:MAG TPA: Rid family detoxifying hydrolase [Membranihabitans sp.]|nr:Rid family detoxifying hydrolase [Membranihabitans sp.]